MEIKIKDSKQIASAQRAKLEARLNESPDAYELALKAFERVYIEYLEMELERDLWKEKCGRIQAKM